MTAEPLVRPVRDSERDPLVDLKCRTFDGLDPAREQRRWDWQYLGNPFRSPDSPLAWVVELEGKIAGCYGLLPWRVTIDGVATESTCGIDFAVEPELRGRRLGHAVAERFMDPAFTPFPFITSPTPATCHLMGTYGATILRGRDEPCLWVRGRGAAPPPADDAGLVRLARFDERADALWERLARRHRLVTPRTSDYLQWRYAEYPFGGALALGLEDGSGGLRGILVYQRQRRLGQAYVCELIVDADDAQGAARLLARAAERARDDACDLYALQRDAALQSHLAAAGFDAVAEHPLEFLCRPPASGPSIDDWVFTAGDGDRLFDVGELGEAPLP